MPWFFSQLYRHFRENWRPKDHSCMEPPGNKGSKELETEKEIAFPLFQSRDIGREGNMLCYAMIYLLCSSLCASCGPWAVSWKPTCIPNHGILWITPFSHCAASAQQKDDLDKSPDCWRWHPTLSTVTANTTVALKSDGKISLALIYRWLIGAWGQGCTTLLGEAGMGKSWCPPFGSQAWGQTNTSWRQLEIWGKHLQCF